MIGTDKNYIFPELTEKIIGCAYTVFNTLGSGFLEKVYENALKLEIEKEGLKVIQQPPYQCIVWRTDSWRVFC